MEQWIIVFNDCLFGAGMGCIASFVFYRAEIIKRIKKFIRTV